MSDTPHQASRWDRRQRIVAFVEIAATVLFLLIAFAFAAGLFSPERLAPGRYVDALEARGGVHPGFRRAHAKGVCAVGRFQAAEGGAALSHASVFRAGADYPVIARFSTGGGVPTAPDGRNAFRSMALSIDLPGGEVYRMAMNHVPIFVVSNPASFPALHLAHKPDPQTGRADPARVAQFFQTHPETAPFRAYMAQHDLPSSFANSVYHSANSFRFVDHAGNKRFVKWRFEPLAEKKALDRAQLAGLPRDFLFRDLTDRLKSGAATWTMVAALAEAGDVINDPTIAWTGPRREIEMGVLTISSLASEDDGLCRDINFDPLMLPRGIEPSDDPILFARSAAYSASLTRRLGERGEPAAFSPRRSK